VQRLCQGPAPPSPLAPVWHTRALLCVLLAAPTAGILANVDAAAPQLGSASYLPLLLVDVAFAIYVARIGLGVSKLGALLGAPLGGARAALGEAARGLALAMAIIVFDAIWQRLLGSPESLARHALLPSSAAARALWVVVALSTAFSEELIYRGYLQRQLGAMTGRAGFGVLLQAFLFGIAHGQQGPSATLRATVYGVALGCVARRRGGLAAVFVCHLAIDLYAGSIG